MNMMDVRENVPLAPLTTFKIGGPARYFVDVHNEEEMKAALAWARERGTRCVVLAGKSNILVPDEGLNALVISIASETFSFAGTELAADAGCNLLSLIRAAGEKSLGGWEKLAGIPGTIGGAVRGNAGAFGPEIKDFVTKGCAFDADTGEMREFENVACNFSSRHSFFKDDPKWIITRAYSELARAEPVASARETENTITERERRHIQNVQAAGSYFMNPVASEEARNMFEEEKGGRAREGRVPAGWLIEKAGMKGARVGDAVASEQHPNYIKNDGKATARDVLALARQIKDAVKDKFGVEMREEAVVL